MDENAILPVRVVIDVLRYLGKQPYDDVVDLIGALRAARRIEPPAPPPATTE